MYLTYEEYSNMGGTLDEDIFNSFNFEANAIVDYYTFNRLHKIQSGTYPEAIKRCIYKIIDLLITKSNVLVQSSDSTPIVSSESNDGVSVSYNVLSADNLISNCEKEVNKIIKLYLENIQFDSKGRKLLYRGVYPDE